MWCIKAAFICIYIDMATHLPNGIRRIIRFVSYILVLSWVVSNLVFLCWCLPFERNWKLDRNLCSSQTSKFAISFVSCQHLVTDCMVLVLPVLILRQLHLQKTEKWAVGIIFVLGLFTVGAGTVGYALRLQAQIHVAQRRTGTGPAAAMIAEFKNRMAVVHLVSTAEAACAIVVLCLPSMRVLLTKSRSMRRKIVGSNLRGRVMRKDTLEIIDSSSGFEPAAVAPTLQAIQMQDVEANRAPSGRQFCREDAYRVRKDFEWDTVLTPPSRESVGELGNS
ncbi:hypothetical protein EDC01DRAFT_343312 [Geopyxis carbonaria]|nr:hypothetical protein EDC01DRAFT_343312 [Geopyxis carbonaria]